MLKNCINNKIVKIVCNCEKCCAYDKYYDIIFKDKNAIYRKGNLKWVLN